MIPVIFNLYEYIIPTMEPLPSIPNAVILRAIQSTSGFDQLKLNNAVIYVREQMIKAATKGNNSVVVELPDLNNFPYYLQLIENYLRENGYDCMAINFKERNKAILGSKIPLLPCVLSIDWIDHKISL